MLDYVLAAEQLDLLAMVNGLYNSGFTTTDIKKYLRIWQSITGAGTASAVPASTVPASGNSAEECVAMLRTQKRQLWQQLENIQAGIDFLERQEELLSEHPTPASEQSHQP